VILGIGAGVFTEDARKSLGLAIGEAEKTEHKGKLPLKIWRKGAILDNVTIPLAVMGVPWAVGGRCACAGKFSA